LKNEISAYYRRSAPIAALPNSSTANSLPRANGNKPAGFVVLEASATATETELCNYARDHLAHFKVSQQIHFVPELPKTATGKVQKYVLRGKPAISKQ
jgi:acyl-coenzyme A synthetase/AMP-(fatty) acid ligase